MFYDHNCQGKIPNCVEISTKSLSKRENSSAIFLVFLRVNPIAQRAYYRFLHCLQIFALLLQIFALLLQIFALFWMMFGINCTRINQSQPRNISLYIIIVLIISITTVLTIYSNNINLVSPTELCSIPTRITVRRNNLPKLRPRFHARKVTPISLISSSAPQYIPIQATQRKYCKNTNLRKHRNPKNLVKVPLKSFAKSEGSKSAYVPTFLLSNVMSLAPKITPQVQMMQTC